MAQKTVINIFSHGYPAFSPGLSTWLFRAGHAVGCIAVMRVAYGFSPQLAHNMRTAFSRVFPSLIPTESERFYRTLGVLETPARVYCRTCRQVDLSQP
jgi:hypothetical protein